MSQSALTWLKSGGNSTTGSAAAAPAGAALAAALPRSLQLLSARLQLAGKPPPLATWPLTAPWAATAAEGADEDPVAGAALSSRFASPFFTGSCRPGKGLVCFQNVMLNLHL
jgi:hypothetical protein